LRAKPHLGKKKSFFFKRLYLRDPLTDFARNTRKMTARTYILHFYDIYDENLSAVGRKFTSGSAIRPRRRPGPTPKIDQNPSNFQQKLTARAGLVLGAPSELSERIALTRAAFSAVSSISAFNP
jgi:hypothetical protein